MLGDIGEEGDDVVVDLGFDPVDPLDAEGGAGPDAVKVGGGNDAELMHSLAGQDLDFEPDGELVPVFPDSAHFGPCIPCDHDNTPLEKCARSLFYFSPGGKNGYWEECGRGSGGGGELNIRAQGTWRARLAEPG